MNTFKSTLLCLPLVFASVAQAKEPIKEAVSEVKAGAHKAVRAAKDAACPLVDGKVKCAAKKVQHAAEDVVDDAKK